jgi:hypothetical protein
MNTPVLKGKTQPVDAATLAAFQEKRAQRTAAAQACKPASERKRASAPERAPADPYVYGHLVTNNGIVSAQMRRSTFEAMSVHALASRTNETSEAPRSQGLPAYEAPAMACRSQNYNRATLWQSAKTDRVYFSRG